MQGGTDMHTYTIVFAFLDSKGAVQCDDEGIEIYYKENISAKDKESAIGILKEKVKFNFEVIYLEEL